MHINTQECLIWY